MESITLSGAVTSFLMEKSASGRSLHTLADYRNYLRVFEDYLKDYSISRVTSENITAYMNYMQFEYKVKRAGIETNALLSPKTLANIRSIMGSFWKWAAANYNIENPCKIQWVRAPQVPIYPLTEDEVAAMLKAIDDPSFSTRNGTNYAFKRRTRKRDRAVIYALLDTGARATELCEARIKDLEIDAGRLKVTGKGRKTRFVYLGRKGRGAVWAYLMERYPNARLDHEAYLLLDDEGYDPLNRDSLRHLLLRIGKRANVANPHPHRWRHTFAIEYLRNGGDVFTLQQLLGHTTLTMVMQYVQLAQVDMERVHKKANPSDNWRVR